MFQGNAKVIAAGVGALVLVGTLAGCASGGGSDEPTATKTVTKTASPAPSPSDSASAGSGSGSGSPGSSSSGSGSSGSGSSGSSGSGSGSAAGSRCAAADLTGTIEAGSGGAAGSTITHIALRNSGSTTCTLQGWPGVSFVGGSNGTQIGTAATLDRGATHPTVTLRPGQTAVAPLKVVNWQNYSNAECAPRPVDGYRVYPPGSKQSVFIAAKGTACSDKAVDALSVQAFVPEGQATD